MNDGPLIGQSDKTLLLEVDHERAAECRKAMLIAMNIDPDSYDWGSEE